MSVDADVIIETLREQAWERAKGELRAVLTAYRGQSTAFTAAQEKIDAFIKDIEDNFF